MTAHANALVSPRSHPLPSQFSLPSSSLPPRSHTRLTHNAQPLRAQDIQHPQARPQHGLQIQRQPEEAAVGFVVAAAAADAGGGGLEHPRAAAGGGVDLVPPPQADEPPAGDVFQVVEVGGEEEDREDEDEDAVCWGRVSGRCEEGEDVR